MSNCVRLLEDEKGSIGSNSIKKKVKTISYRDGQKYYNFFLIKFSKRYFSISEKTISRFKSFVYSLLGLLVATLFCIKPISIETFVNIIKNIGIKIGNWAFFITPYARYIPNKKFLFSINAGSLMTSIIILLFFFVAEDLFVDICQNVCQRLILSIILFLLIWYINYLVSFMIMKIEICYYFFAFIVLLCINFTVDIILFFLLIMLDDYI